MNIQENHDRIQNIVFQCNGGINMNLLKNNKETKKNCSLKNNPKYNVVFSTSTRHVKFKLEKIGFGVLRVKKLRANLSINFGFLHHEFGFFPYSAKH